MACRERLACTWPERAGDDVADVGDDVLLLAPLLDVVDDDVVVFTVSCTGVRGCLSLLMDVVERRAVLGV